MGGLKVGQAAPDFWLPSTGKEGWFQLSDFRDRFVILFFYPKDFTPMCTKEACSFRDLMPSFSDKGGEVIVAGISPDTLDSHELFASKFRLTYPLLADTDHRIAELYEVWGEVEFKGELHPSVIRSTYIIDPEGNICRKYYNISLKGHLGNVLDDLKSEKRRFKRLH